MGVSGRKHFLPAPTDSLAGSIVDEVGGVSEDIETDLSRRTDRTSYTIPEDSTPVTISVPPKKKVTGRTQPGNSSRTSLLIEVYEGVDKNQRTSLRVRLPSPSEAKDGQSEHSLPNLQKHSYTKRVPLTKKSLEKHLDQEDTDELSEVEVSAPVDIGAAAKASDISGLSQYPELKYFEPGSDVSSMPGESVLASRNPQIVLQHPAASSIVSRSDLAHSTLSDMPGSNSDLKPPVLSSELNLSHERITQKAIEKLSSKDRSSARSGRRHSDKSRSRSSGGIVATGSGERRRKSSRHHGEESSLSTGTEPSQLSNSVVSAGAKSAASETSNITNPKLLKTVEDAIKRLILPELLEIKRNGSYRQSYREDDYSDVSENSIARDKEQSRRVSGGESQRRRRSGKDHGSSSRRRSQRDYDDDSESLSSISEAKYRNRGVMAGAMAGAAVAGTALHHQDSSSTLEDRRQRRKRSKSHSNRSASLNDSEEIFEKHDVPPMPFVSEISSDLTRSSILSSNTANTATPTQRDVREVIKGSPLVDPLSEPMTPTRAPGDLRNSLGLYHRNVSGQDLNSNQELHQHESPVSPEADYTPETVRELPYHSSPVITDPERMRLYERNLHQQHPIRKGLSPIASVASYATTEPARNSLMHARSMDSIESGKHHHQRLKQEVSMDSFSSASPDLQKRSLSRGVAVENDNLHHYSQGQTHARQDPYDEYDDESSQTDDYRDSYATHDDPKADVRRLTTYTDESAELPILDKAGSGQHVARGIAANPQYVSIAPGVESAVASLVEPSVIDTPSSPYQSYPYTSQSKGSLHSAIRDGREIQSQSPLRENMSGQLHGSATKLRQFISPPQSPADSFEQEKDVLDSTPADLKTDDTPESEITTNPSVIQGPIVGLTSSGRDRWQYSPAVDRSNPNFPAQQALNRDFGGPPDLIPPALNVSQRNTFTTKPEVYPIGMVAQTPPNQKDEGYITGDTGNNRSPGPYNIQNDRDLTPEIVEEDPFITKRNQYTSGLSQGMSPLYDAATGRGMDRIQSKDIVALMDHLTVRDAQRNARDTEILFTLVRSAAEMRNQFEDMKKFITEQDELLLGAGERQHEKTQKVIGGPRPLPTNRSGQRSTVSHDDLPAKRRNIFQRAVQRLGSKNETEIQNIEQMLLKLLHDVEELRIAQTGTSIAQSVSHSQNMRSISGSNEDVPASTDPGYEPEGQAGTSSTGNRSGMLSGTSSRQAEYLPPGSRKDVTNRISTVEEGNEDFDDYDDILEDDKVTPRASPAPDGTYRESRAQSEAVSTPKMQGRLSGPWSQENTPQYNYEPSSAGRRHKSIASSLFPKGLISRWSKTTASTMPERQSMQKARPYSQVSQSGSDLAGYQYEPRPEDQLQPLPGQDDYYDGQDNRPPSPLVPSQVSENPKYQGYRNSQNLQHPQPRQGPTGRYQHHLESEAVTYNDQFSPTSQTSFHLEGQPVMARVNNIRTYAPQPPLSPISDTGYSATSSRMSARGPPRPPKEVDSDPLIPQRSKGTMSPSTYVEHVTAARGGSPAYNSSPIQPLRSHPVNQAQRKPSGPRPISSSGSTSTAKPVKGDFNAVKRTRFRGSPYQIDSEENLHRREI